MVRIVVGTVAGSDEPRSTCCRAALLVSRQVHDTVTYAVEKFIDGRLEVRYLTVYPGEADDFEVECSRCHNLIETEVEEL